MLALVRKAICNPSQPKKDIKLLIEVRSLWKTELQTELYLTEHEIYNGQVEGKAAYLSSDSAPIEKRAKRERKSGEVEVEPATTTACGWRGKACWSNHEIDGIPSLVSGFQLYAQTL